MRCKSVTKHGLELIYFSKTRNFRRHRSWLLTWFILRAASNAYTEPCSRNWDLRELATGNNHAFATKIYCAFGAFLFHVHASIALRTINLRRLANRSRYNAAVCGRVIHFRKHTVRLWSDAFIAFCIVNLWFFANRAGRDAIVFGRVVNLRLFANWLFDNF